MKIGQSRTMMNNYVSRTGKTGCSSKLKNPTGVFATSPFVGVNSSLNVCRSIFVGDWNYFVNDYRSSTFSTDSLSVVNMFPGGAVQLQMAACKAQLHATAGCPGRL